MSTPPHPDLLSTLTRLLAELFTTDELRIFLRGWPEGRELEKDLPVGVGINMLASEASVRLVDRRMVDGAFCERLHKVRPARSDGIRAIRVLAGGRAPRPPRPAGASPRFKSSFHQQVSAQLRAAYRRRRERMMAGLPTDEADAEIVALKRQLRDGPELVAGDILGGRYELLEQLGRGGFATVWKAWDDEHDGGRGRLVAVKVLHGQWSADSTRRERFFRGARNMKRLHHPGVVRVFEEKAEDSGHHYFVMEYFSGGDLRRAILGKLLSGAEGLEAVLQVGEALQAAHDAGMTHRDIKPANILLDADGRPRLTDFDLVNIGESTGGTRTGVGMGSFVYAAPEVMDNAQDAGARSDVYSLAMTALFCLFGQPVPSSILWRTEHHILLLSCDDAIKDVLRKALSKAPQERHASITALCEALRGVGDRWTVALEGLPDFEMAWIPEGHFVMGSPESEEGRYSDEGPAHDVSLSAFWMGVVPVTQALWTAVMGSNPSRRKEDAHPVEMVTWFDAARFCNVLSERAGRTPVYRFGPQRKGRDVYENTDVVWKRYADGFRLPTEAEWEYACRAGTTTRFWSGDSEQDLALVGWYSENSEGRTHAVGEKPANPWGLHDMHGNVWEWCMDSFASYLPKGLQDPFISTGRVRVIRGGFFGFAARGVRSVCRGNFHPGRRGGVLGFRLVCGPPPAGALVVDL